jgi:hypothetical protein
MTQPIAIGEPIRALPWRWARRNTLSVAFNEEVFALGFVTAIPTALRIGTSITAMRTLIMTRFARFVDVILILTTVAGCQTQVCHVYGFRK